MITQIASKTPFLSTVIQHSIGNPTLEKIQQILNEYDHDGCLIGYFDEQKLVGCLGYFIKNQTLTVKHISVLPSHQKLGIGSKLINYIKQIIDIQSIILETDQESLNFYQKLGFECTFFICKQGYERYKCILEKA